MERHGRSGTLGRLLHQRLRAPRTSAHVLRSGSKGSLCALRRRELQLQRAPPGDLFPSWRRFRVGAVRRRVRSSAGLLILALANLLASPTSAHDRADCVVEQLSLATQDEVATIFEKAGVRGLNSWTPNNSEVSRVAGDCGLGQVDLQFALGFLRAGAIKQQTANALAETYHTPTARLTYAWSQLSPSERYSFRRITLGTNQNDESALKDSALVLNHIIALLGGEPIKAGDIERRPGLRLLIDYYCELAAIEVAETKLR